MDGSANSSSGAQWLPSATSSPQSAHHALCGELVATCKLEGVQEEFELAVPGAAGGAHPRCCMASSHSMPAERSACLLRQAGLLRTDRSDTLATVERIGIDIDGIGRCAQRRLDPNEACWLKAHGSSLAA